jgi:hypothetical protein
MVLPLIPIAAALAAGGIGFGVGGALLGGKKEETLQTYAPTYGQVYHASGETYAPQIQYAPQSGYSYTGATYIVNSPYASSKKETALTQGSNPSQEGSWQVPQSYEVSPTVSPGSGMALDSGTLIPIAIIGAVAVVGYALFTGGGKK